MRQPAHAVALLLLLIQPLITQGIIGYDCGSPSSNLTTLSLLDIEECNIPRTEATTKRTYVQLLQINEFDLVKVYQCKVEVDRLIKRCGMFSHTSDVLNGKHSYIEEVVRKTCLHMHTYGTYQLGGTTISGLRSNQTTTRPVTLAGIVEVDGTCSGTAYTDPYGAWDKVVVLASVKITLTDYMANIRINANRVLLRSGVTCGFNSDHCLDVEGGNTFWEITPTDRGCKLSEFGLIYNGYATKISDSSRSSPDVYSIVEKDTLFALTTRDKFTVCGLPMLRTEHPRLVIFQTTENHQVFQRSILTPNMDMFTYVNSKFVYVERHIRQQINQLYMDVLLQQCSLEKKILQNALAIATQAPDVFAYYLMKGPGYMAMLAGEVIHIVKCVPVEVKIATADKCFAQLPVLKDNNTYYLTPQTHILVRQSTQIPCNALAPSMYLLGDAWYKFTPKPVDALPPTMMRAMTKPTWKYINPGSLATSGIYTQDDLKGLRDYIMFPAERPALLNTIAGGIMGHPGSIAGGSLSNLLDESAINKIAANAWERIWGKFLIFGNISAGFIGVYLAFRMCKLVLDTLVHGYALHTVYGWSLYLLGAIWDSLTQLLLHTGRSRSENSRRKASLSSEPDMDNPEPPAETPEPKGDEPRKNPASSSLAPLIPLRERTQYSLELKP